MWRALRAFIAAHPIISGILIFLLVSSLGLYVAVLWGAFGPLPTEEELAELEIPLASEVFAANGQRLGKYYLEDRTDVRYEELAPDLLMALIATEDARFYQHSGVDMRSMARVLVKSVLMQDKRAGGGSTLSQQVAKNYFPRQRYPMLSLPINKLRELFIARRLERVYSKEEILTLYLNTMSFGENAYGIRVASRRFFNCTPDSLKLEEAAVLVGLLKAPTAYNPRLHPEKALERRNLVINQMATYGYISEAERDSLVRLPLQLNYRLATHNDGLAPYFREFLRLELAEWCQTYARPDGSHYDLYRDGLKIHTTIDPRVQAHAEAAVREEMQRLQGIFDRAHRQRKLSRAWQNALAAGIKRSQRYKAWVKAGKSEASIDSLFRIPVRMELFTWEGAVDTLLSPRDSVKYYQLFLQAGLMAVEPQTGEVKAWVGGIDHQFFKFDHVTATRQTGSIFKPLVYAAALEHGIPPCQYISNEQESLKPFTSWVPRNADNFYGGEYSMEGALTYSVNIATVNLMFQTGTEAVIETAKNLGVSTELPNVPSLALGTADISLYDMLSAYGTFANRGKACKPIFVSRIEDRDGNVIYAPYEQTNQSQVIRRETAEQVIHMLQGVVNRGTARGLRRRYGLRNDIAGKTGTTQDQADGWFVGAMPSLVAGVWVGADDRRIHFRTMSSGQGARTAMPIYANFIRRLLRDEDYAYLGKERFPRLSYQLQKNLDCDPFVFRKSMTAFKAWWEEQQRKAGN